MDTGCLGEYASSARRRFKRVRYKGMWICTAKVLFFKVTVVKTVLQVAKGEGNGADKLNIILQSSCLN